MKRLEIVMVFLIVVSQALALEEPESTPGEFSNKMQLLKEQIRGMVSFGNPIEKLRNAKERLNEANFLAARILQKAYSQNLDLGRQKVYISKYETGQEKVEKQEVLERIEEEKRETTQLLGIAKRDKDDSFVLCVEEKLVEINYFQKLVEEEKEAVKLLPYYDRVKKNSKQAMYCGSTLSKSKVTVLIGEQSLRMNRKNYSVAPTINNDYVLASGKEFRSEGRLFQIENKEYEITEAEDSIIVAERVDYEIEEQDSALLREVLDRYEVTLRKSFQKLRKEEDIESFVDRTRKFSPALKNIVETLPETGIQKYIETTESLRSKAIAMLDQEKSRKKSLEDEALEMAESIAFLRKECSGHEFSLECAPGIEVNECVKLNGVCMEGFEANQGCQSQVSYSHSCLSKISLNKQKRKRTKWSALKDIKEFQEANKEDAKAKQAMEEFSHLDVSSVEPAPIPEELDYSWIKENPFVVDDVTNEDEPSCSEGKYFAHFEYRGRGESLGKRGWASTCNYAKGSAKNKIMSQIITETSCKEANGEMHYHSTNYIIGDAEECEGEGRNSQGLLITPYTVEKTMVYVCCT